MGKRTKKRKFERSDGQLIDRTIDSRGKQVTHYAAASSYGESLTPAQRKKLLARAKRGEGGVFALRGEESPEHRDAMLGALATGDIMAPGSLRPYVDQPHVQRALVAAARAQPPGDGANHFQALGSCGGPGVEALLAERLAALLADPTTFDDHSFFNDKAGELSTVASAWLRLNADATAAGEALVKLLEHPCGFNRRRAVMEMKELLVGSSHHGWMLTEAFRRMRQALRPLVRERDPGVFLAA